MPYILTKKAGILAAGIKVAKGQTISDEEYGLLDDKRQCYFKKAAEKKAKAKAKKSDEAGSILEPIE